VLAGGANTYTGTTAINGGILRISADNHLGTAPGSATANKLTFDGGTLETTATFTLNANRGTTINAGGGTFDVNSGTTLTYNGILAGSGTLTKADTGTLILGGTTTNTHTGDINVDAGTLQINKTGGANRAIGDSATVTVASGANLTFTGGQSETIGALAGGGTLDNTTPPPSPSPPAATTPRPPSPGSSRTPAAISPSPRPAPAPRRSPAPPPTPLPAT
jgi:autotransporter-associated beta strand protein